MQNDHIPKSSLPTTPDVKVPKVRPGKRLEKPNVNVRRRAIRETARLWHDAMATASSVCFIKGRVKFGVLRSNRRQEAASHPSALLGWNTDLAPCVSIGSVVPLMSRSA